MKDLNQHVIKMITDFPLNSSSSNLVTLFAAKIKIIAFLSEEAELAARGIYYSSAASKIEELLSNQTGVLSLPAQLTDAFLTFNIVFDETQLPSFLEELRSNAGYSDIFDWLSMSLSLDSLD